MEGFGNNLLACLRDNAVCLQYLRECEIAECNFVSSGYREEWCRFDEQTTLEDSDDICELNISSEVHHCLLSIGLTFQRLRDCEQAEKSFHETDYYRRLSEDYSQSRRSLQKCNSDENSEEYQLCRSYRKGDVSQNVSPSDGVLQDVSPPGFVLQDVSLPDGVSQDVLPLGCVLQGVSPLGGHWTESEENSTETVHCEPTTGLNNLVSGGSCPPNVLVQEAGHLEQNTVHKNLSLSPVEVGEASSQTDMCLIASAVFQQDIQTQTSSITATQQHATQTGSCSHTCDALTQTNTVFSQCCRCNVFALPLPEQYAVRLREETSKRITLEQLSSIVEQESANVRMQFIAEQNKTLALQSNIEDIKCELGQERHLAAEYKTRNDDLKQALEGAHSMINKLEEQIQSTNLFKGGIDYLLESKLANSKAAECQTRVEVLQNELVQSHQEVQHLLDKLAQMNRDRSEMISSSVHHELMKISDDRAREAELKVLQLEHEIRTLKSLSHVVPPLSAPTDSHVTTTVPVPGSLTHHVAPPISVQRDSHMTTTAVAVPESFIFKDHQSTYGRVKHSSVTSGKQTSPGLPLLPDLDHIKSPSEGVSKGLQSTCKPLFVTNDSDENGWSSDDNEAESHHSVSSIARQWEKMAGHPSDQEHRVHFNLPTSVKSAKPPVPSKPKTLPKPIVPIYGVGVQEKSVSFDQVPVRGNLKLVTRLRGPAGRRLPTRINQAT